MHYYQYTDTDETNGKSDDFTPRQGIQLGDEPSLFEGNNNYP